MSICQRIGTTVAAWTTAGTLATVNTIDHSHYYMTLPWILIALSIAITSSMSLMIWKSQNEVVSDLRGDHAYMADEPSLRVVP